MLSGLSYRLRLGACRFLQRSAQSMWTHLAGTPAVRAASVALQARMWRLGLNRLPAPLSHYLGSVSQHETRRPNGSADHAESRASDVANPGQALAYGPVALLDGDAVRRIGRVRRHGINRFSVRPPLDILTWSARVQARNGTSACAGRIILPGRFAAAGGGVALSARRHALATPPLASAGQ
jgi:hypothetical protein